MSRPRYEPLLVTDPLLQWWHPGEPVPKGRPQFDTRGARPRAYTPSATVKAEKAARATFAEGAPESPLEGLVLLELLLVVSPPGAHRKLPDVDNLAKLVLDAGSRIVWKDDRTVTDLLVRRRVVDDPARLGTLVLVGVPR